ncbi:enhancing factor [Yersinia pseudotuberculosis]|uniref:Enhancing factor n=1 Tax=Yersinia pseudotuberculosis TaxID=633 RepID=A0A380Q3H5_YERPU|nr:enhancing factor [Yersinia pseudotuberculosis]
MLEKVGVNCFTHFNQIYRERKNTDQSVDSVLDMLSNSFATVENRVDVTPFLQMVGGIYLKININVTYLAMQRRYIH